jgi:hypothetical protein
MPFTVEARTAEALVFVTHRGRLTLEEARAAQDEVAALLRAKGLRGVLLDLCAAEDATANRGLALAWFTEQAAAVSRLGQPNPPA